MIPTVAMIFVRHGLALSVPVLCQSILEVLRWLAQLLFFKVCDQFQVVDSLLRACHYGGDAVLHLQASFVVSFACSSISSYWQSMSKSTFPMATLSATWFRQLSLDQLADIEFLLSG